MSFVDRLKKWIDDNEDDFKVKSEKAIHFIEELGHELNYTGMKISEEAEKAFHNVKKKWQEKKGEEMNDTDENNPYEASPQDSNASYFEEESNDDLSTEQEETKKEATAVEHLMDNIDNLIADLKEKEEAVKPDERDHLTAIKEDWKGLDDDFIKKAAAFADRKMSPGKGQSKSSGSTKGFEDTDKDGNDIIDDAIID